MTGTLRIGFTPGAALELTEPILTEFRSRFPEVSLELHEYPLVDPTGGLADGSADVSFIRLPFSADGLETETLFTEPLAVAVAANHRLAGRSSVEAGELLDEPLTMSGSSDPVYRDFYLLNAFRAGAAPPKIFPTTSVTEEQAIVASGVACGIIPAAAMRYIMHPGVRCLPIVDAAPSVVVLAWQSQHDGPLVERLREVACAVRDRETEIVAKLEHPPTLYAEPL